MNEHEAYSDELISAYLDGELTSEEQAHVEQMLSENASCRELFDELKVLSSSLQSLPRHRLDKDFYRRVLRGAERAMLSPSHDEADRVPPESGSAPVGPDDANVGLDRGSWRGVVWAVAAIAAAVLLILYSPNGRDGRDVAKVAETAGKAAGDRQPPATGEEKKGQPAAVVDSEGLAQDRPGESAAQRPTTAHADASPAREMTAADHAGRKSGGVRSAPLRDAAPAKKPAGPGGAVGAQSAEPLESPIANGRPLALDGAANDADAGGGAAKRAAAAPALRSRAGGMGGAIEAFSAMPGDTQEPRGGNAITAEGRDAGVEAPAPSLPATDVPATAAPAMVDAILGTGAVDRRLIVISVDCTAQAINRRVFDRSLSKQGIRLDDESSKQRQSAFRRREPAATTRREPAATTQAGRSARGAFKAESIVDNMPSTPEAAPEPRSSGDMDIVYVVATAGRMAGLLDDLKAQPEQFLHMAADRPLRHDGKASLDDFSKTSVAPTKKAEPLREKAKPDDAVEEAEQRLREQRDAVQDRDAGEDAAERPPEKQKEQRAAKGQAAARARPQGYARRIVVPELAPDRLGDLVQRYAGGDRGATDKSGARVADEATAAPADRMVRILFVFHAVSP